MKEIQHIVGLNETFVKIYPVAVTVCESLVKEMELDGKYICPGIISSYGPVVGFSCPLLGCDVTAWNGMVVVF